MKGSAWGPDGCLVSVWRWVLWGQKKKGAKELQVEEDEDAALPTEEDCKYGPSTQALDGREREMNGWRCIGGVAALDQRWTKLATVGVPC